MATPTTSNVNSVRTPEFQQALAAANDSLYCLNNTMQPIYNPNQFQSTPISTQGQPILNISQPMPCASLPAHPNSSYQQSQMQPFQQGQNDNTLQAILETIHNMNARLNKLDMLDQLCARMSVMESNFDKINSEIKDIRHDLKQQSERLSNEEFHYNIIENRVSDVENERDILKFENTELKERLLEMQTYSMKYNLIFSGVEETQSEIENETENTEEVVKKFIKDELSIDATFMQFCNVHRLRQRTDGRPRNIIAKFVKYCDHEAVRSKAMEKLKERKDVSVYQQYPAEINTRRRELIPKMHELRRQGHRNARIVIDKLYIGSELVDPSQITPASDDQQTYNQRPGTGPPYRPQYRGFGPSFRPPSWGQAPPGHPQPRGPAPVTFRGPPPHVQQGQPPATR